MCWKQTPSRTGRFTISSLEKPLKKPSPSPWRKQDLEWSDSIHVGMSTEQTPCGRRRRKRSDACYEWRCFLDFPCLRNHEGS
ncbi:mCG57387, isoform CRA_b [Mus musculus]|nr:mCG57387, isoform CRA_b [Mus musculus]